MLLLLWWRSWCWRLAQSMLSFILSIQASFIQTSHGNEVGVLVVLRWCNCVERVVYYNKYRFFLKKLEMVIIGDTGKREK